MKFKYLVLMIFLGLALIINSACTRPNWIACRDLATKSVEKGGKYQYNEQQWRAACVAVERQDAGKFDEKTGVWLVDYTKLITIEDALKVVVDMRKSLNLLLSYEDDYTARWVDFFEGFRKGLEREEKKSRWIEQRLKYFVNYRNFVDKVGEIDSEAAKKLMPYGPKTYSLRLIYPMYDPKELRFTADYVESAKKSGFLKLVNEFPVVEQKKFAEKIVDRNDPNKFVWKEHNRGWLIKAYKILPDKEQPVNSNIDYLEVYKAKFKKADGEKFEAFEKEFCVAGFKARGKESVNVLVIDYDWEAIRGFSPDKIFESFTDIVTGGELFYTENLRKEALEVLYNPPIAEEKEYRKKPPEKPLYVEIATMGEVSVDLWEKSEEGFVVPFAYSSHGPGKFDTEFQILWKKPQGADEEKTQGEHGLKQIEFLKQSFKKSGALKVMEYYAPKKDYSKRDVKEGFAVFDSIRIRRSDKPEENAGLKYFAEKVMMIDYEYGGKWFRLLDKDGDGKFERRMKIADPTIKSRSSGLAGYNYM